MKKGKMKIVASLIVFAITFSYFSIIQSAIASSLEDQTSKTNQANVEFDSYFIENDQKVHSSVKNIGEKNYLYATIVVKNAGYLKDAKIEIDNANFKIADNFTAREVAKVDGNKIYFNKIANGNTATVAIPIEMNVSEFMNINEFSSHVTAKFTGIYVDGNAKENQTKKDIELETIWTAKKEAELNAQITKFLQYDVNSNKGILLQTTLQSYLKDNTLPVKETYIEIDAPTIKNVKPDEVKVMANTTKATNGDETGIKFTNQNFTYDKTTGKLKITVSNEMYKYTVNSVEHCDVTWKKNAIDEFAITYIYKEKQGELTLPITVNQESGVEINVKANSKITTYEVENTTATKEINGQATLTNTIGELAEFEVKTTESISKGQIYANYEAETKQETEYKEEITANIGLTKVGTTDIVNKVTLELNADNFITENNAKFPTTVSNKNYAYFKELKISQDRFNKILSEDGDIKIYNGTTLVSTINKEMQADSQGKLVVDLKDLNVNTLKIETSKPVTEGKLTIEITKAIKEDIGYNKTQAQTFKKLGITLIGTALNGTTNILAKTLEKEIALTEPTSQAEVTINNNGLSTSAINQNVKITAILKTNTLDCNLYKNPTLQIILPKYVETLNIKNVEVLFDTEGTKLTLKDHKIIENTDGTKTIEVKLEGMQTEYALSAVAKGVNVVITTDITVNKLTPSRQEQIKMIYTNESTQETNEVSTPVNFVAPAGVVTISTISNYKENAESLTSISGEEKVATIETMAEARNAKFEMTVINNYYNTIDNISILGKIPTEQNKDIGSTMDMPLVSGITVNSNDNSKVSVYYSENVNATKDLTLASNGWTKTPEDLSKAKVYLIVFTDYTMNTGDMVSFGYEAQIPANLQYNQSAYANYTVNFNNNFETGTVQDVTKSTKIGVTTGKGPVIEVFLTSDTEESKQLLAGDIVKYTLTVKNVGTEVANNVVAKFIVPKGLTYVEEDEESNTGYKTIAVSENEVNIQLGDVNANQTIIKEFLMQVNYISPIDSDTTTDKNITTEIDPIITSDSIKGEIKTETEPVKNTVGETSYITTTNIIDNKPVLNEEDKFQYSIEVLSSDIYIKKEKTVVEVVLPKEIEYEGIEVKYRENKQTTDITNSVTYNYDKNSRKLIVNLGEVDGRNAKLIYIKVKTNKLEENVYDKEANIEARIYGKDTNIQKIKVEPIKIGKIGFKVTQTSNIPEGAHITAYEDLKYIFTIENLSSIDLYNIKLTDILPEEVTLNSMTLKKKDANDSNSYKNSMSISLKGKETATLEVNVTANPIEETKKVSNKLKLEYEAIGTIESSTCSHIIDKYDYKEIEDNYNKQTKRIMGQVWEDENKDGIKDENERKMQGIEVLLFNNQTGTLVTDETGNMLKAVTDKNGNYTFEKINRGKYTAIFLYDAANYSATEYRKSGVDESKNSDAIDSKITLDGITRIAAITEEINITESNIYNMDLGLISNPKFDLKLDKTVTRITVQSGNETQVYDYNDAKLAKKDLIGKDVNNTSIIVEYKLKVTNEGAVAGYAKKIVDYMPSEMKFNSELNKDWYTNGNGAIYNSSLANILINPGESKEVTLTLTKKMTENNLGLYSNTAEIYEAYNDKGLQDYDSTPGNKTSGEDDISSADVLITLKTGEVIAITVITVIAIAGVCIGAYFINKKVLK